MIPEVIAGYNVYNGDTADLLIGVSNEITLPNFELMTSEISGAGIAGTYNAPVIGYFNDITQEIPFRVLYEQLAALFDQTKRCLVNVRGLMQVVDRTTGIRDRVPMRYIVGGSGTAMNGGSLQLGNPMGSTLSISATYVKLEVGGETLVEIDKLNQVCVIDGKDLLEDVRNYC